MKKIILFTALAFFCFGVNAAPTFGSAFHGLSVTTLLKNLDYYPNQGLHAQTISNYYTGLNGGGIKMAGAFDSRVSAETRMTVRVGADDLVAKFKAWGPEGYAPRQISTLDDGFGIPIFTAIWEKVSVPAAFWINMPDSQFDDVYKDYVVKQGYRLTEHATYTDHVGNHPAVRRHAAVFKKDGQGFYFYEGLDIAAFRQISTQLEAIGYVASSINLGTDTTGESYSVIYTKKTATTVVYPDIAAGGYQREFDRLTKSGFHLIQIVGFRQGKRFAMIWSK